MADELGAIKNWELKKILLVIKELTKEIKTRFVSQSREIKELRRLIMATKKEVLDAIAAEKQQVLDAITALNKLIQDLKDQIAAGTAVTPADLDEIIAAVNDVFIPPTTPPVA